MVCLGQSIPVIKLVKLVFWPQCVSSMLAKLKSKLSSITAPGTPWPMRISLRPSRSLVTVVSLILTTSTSIYASPILQWMSLSLSTSSKKMMKVLRILVEFQSIIFSKSRYFYAHISPSKSSSLKCGFLSTHISMIPLKEMYLSSLSKHLLTLQSTRHGDAWNNSSRKTQSKLLWRSLAWSI